ncbi:MAG: hypothetical protein R6U64_07910 [Bacteroidales bacterium]
MEVLIQKLFDLQFELTIIGAEMDEKINRIDCQPGIHEMVQSESRNLILLAASIKFDCKVLKLALLRRDHSPEAQSKSTRDATAALNDIENLYYNAFKRFVLLLEKLESDPQNQPVEELVRVIWGKLGKTYHQFRKIMMEMEMILSCSSTPDTCS